MVNVVVSDMHRVVYIAMSQVHVPKVQTGHYIDVIMGPMASQITSVVTQPFVQVKDNIKVQRHWSLWGEFTGDQWIPLTKGQ